MDRKADRQTGENSSGGSAPDISSPSTRGLVVSRASIKNRLRQATGAHRTSEAACDALRRRMEELLQDLLKEVGRVYARELAAREIQGLTGHLPDVREQHVEEAFARLREGLKKDRAVPAPWPVRPAAEGVQA